MSIPIYLVSVDSEPQRAKDVTAKVIKAMEKECNLVHIANCESITTVKYILKSLVAPPKLLIISGSWFEEESEEIREIAERVVPGIRLISIPNDLSALDRKGGDGELVEYLREQVENSGVLGRVE